MVTGQYGPIYYSDSGCTRPFLAFNKNNVCVESNLLGTYLYSEGKLDETQCRPHDQRPIAAVYKVNKLLPLPSGIYNAVGEPRRCVAIYTDATNRAWFDATIHPYELTELYTSAMAQITEP